MPLQRLALRGTPKATKAAARYTPAGGAERCGMCRHYVPSSSCARIEGPVSAAGWCQLYSQQVTWRPRAGQDAGFNPGLVPSGATLDLSFMTPGSLDPRITFTRASTGTYFDSTGTMGTATTNAPRWDYNPSTHALNGLLIEEARTNYVFPSGNLAAAPWTTGATGAAPVVTANNATAPDGTLTAARIVMPAVPAGSNASFVRQTPGVPSSGQTVCSIWLRGAVGGEIVNVAYSNFTIWFHATAVLTTAWQRVSVAATSTATGWTFFVGTDMRDATETPNSAQTFYAWGAQTEMGSFPTSYIPTTAASVTRAADNATIPTAAWFNATNGTYQGEFMPNGNAAGLPIIISGNAGSPTIATGADSRLTAGIRSGASVFSATGPLYTFGGVNKAAFAYLSGASLAATNGTAFGPSATVLTVTGTVVEFGSDGVTPGNNALNGYIRRVRYWPRALTNAELQSVTT
jgi:hypothetical protein